MSLILSPARKTVARRPRNINDIPPETILEIFSYLLDHRLQLVVCSDVCKLWTELAAQILHAHMRVYGRKGLAHFAGLLSSGQIPPLRQRLRIVGAGRMVSHPVHSNDIVLFLPLCRHLRVLDLALMPSSRYEPRHLPAPLYNLQELRLHVVKSDRGAHSFTGSTQVLAFFLALAPRARLIAIWGVKWLDYVGDIFPLSPFPLLERLEVKALGGDVQSLLWRLLEGAVGVTSMLVDSSSASKLLPSLTPDLLTLTYEDSRPIERFIAPRDLEALLPHWPKLATLRLPMGCEGLDLQSKSLRRLEFLGPPVLPDQLSPTNLGVIVDELPSLLHLLLPPSVDFLTDFVGNLLPLANAHPAQVARFYYRDDVEAAAVHVYKRRTISREMSALEESMARRKRSIKVVWDWRPFIRSEPVWC